MKITENLFTVSNADAARRVVWDEDYLSQQINCKEQLNLKELWTGKKGGVGGWGGGSKNLKVLNEKLSGLKEFFHHEQGKRCFS